MVRRFDPKRRGQDGSREARPAQTPRHAPSGRPVIYGFHAVIAALQNPRRKAMVLHITENALNRLNEALPRLAITPRLRSEEHTSELQSH